MLSSELTFVVADTIESGLGHLPLPAPDQEVTCLPSSLDRKDRLSSAVRDYLRQNSITSHLLLPDSPLATVFGRIGGRSQPPGTEITKGTHRANLPDRLIAADSVWAIIDISAVAGRGPYALDLVARYADPVTRIRIIGSRNRADRAVALLKQRPVHQFVICNVFSTFVFLAHTSDPIVAELVSLALVDETGTGNHEVIGPWEDDLVQRATESDLGVRLPSDITVSIDGPSTGAPMELIQRLCDRIGVLTG